MPVRATAGAVGAIDLAGQLLELFFGQKRKMKKMMMSPRRWGRLLSALLLLFWLFTLMLLTQDCAFEPEDWGAIGAGEYRWLRCFSYFFTLHLPYAGMVAFSWAWLLPRWAAGGSRRKLLGLAAGYILLGGLCTSFHPFYQELYNGGPGFAVSGISWMESSWYLLWVLLLSSPLYLSYHWFVQRSRIQELDNARLEQELALLRSQVNPHFFFNTLHSLYALSLEQSPRTPEAILKLSSLMRYALTEADAAAVALGRELEVVEQYLELQQMRRVQPAKITFEKQVADEGVRVPPMMMLGLAENAFHHGAETLREGAWIKLSVHADASRMAFRVENNTGGRAAGPHHGKGLVNIERRLSLLYPGRSSLQTALEEGAFSVVLELPLAAPAE